MNIPFYRAFEDRYRGSRELIQERQQVYVPFLEPLIEMYPQSSALDLGCGRGEWLGILAEKGFAPLGVDLDTGMLEACHALGLPVEKGDALEKLKNLPDESQAVVSGFHIAEHIPFDDLKVLVAEALRVLKPAGLLILETPNTENLVVGTQNFFLDPTHKQPIPHLLLSFLTEYSGFGRSKLLRLQESVVLAEGGPVDLLSVLNGVSPDYAIVAQKQAFHEESAKFDAVFAKEYGLSLEVLANRYNAQLLQRDTITIELREQLNVVQNGLQELKTQWQDQMSANEAQIAALLSSTSWRITQPLRAFMSMLRWVMRLAVRVAKRVIRSLLFRGMRFVSSRPRLQLFIINKVRSYPKLFGRLKQFALHHGGMQGDSAVAEDSILTASPRVASIYCELKLAFERKENR